MVYPFMSYICFRPFLALHREQGGAEVAKYCAAHMCDTVRGTEAFREGDMGLGLKQSFLRMDDLLRTPDGQVQPSTTLLLRLLGGIGLPTFGMLATLIMEFLLLCLEALLECCCFQRVTSGGEVFCLVLFPATSVRLKVLRLKYGKFQNCCVVALLKVQHAHDFFERGCFPRSY